VKLLGYFHISVNLSKGFEAEEIETLISLRQLGGSCSCLENRIIPRHEFAKLFIFTFLYVFVTLLLFCKYHDLIQPLNEDSLFFLSIKTVYRLLYTDYRVHTVNIGLKLKSPKSLHQ